MANPFFLLSIAIVSEVIATTALKSSDGFTRLVPSLIVVLGYVTAFYFLSLVLRTIPTGIAYAIWAGVGIVLVSIVAWIVHKQTLDMPAILGLGMIVGGVFVVNVFSKSVGHLHSRHFPDRHKAFRAKCLAQHNDGFTRMPR